MRPKRSDGGGPPFGIPLDVGAAADLRLWLRQVPSTHGPAKAAILLLHGGNSSGDTFLLPEGGFTAFLSARGWDVWILEWRGSPYVVNAVLDGPARGGSTYDECLGYNLDDAAQWDLPLAVAHIRDATDLPLVVLGHCLGSAVATLSLARGHLARFKIATFVLCELGLFVETTWNGWLKSEDFILERVLANDPQCRAIDPKDPARWPAAMDGGLEVWPKAWIPPSGRTSWHRLLHYFSFMVGQPYSLNRLSPSLRSGLVEPVFGPLHLGIYLQAAQSVRRGYLARFNELDILDRDGLARVRRGQPPVAADSDLNPTHFCRERLVLVAAGQSRVWHRDCVDLMYEWLRNRSPSSAVTKLVFPEDGLQELFWGKNCQDVYQGILDALRPIG